MSETSFSLEYFLSVGLALTSVYFINKSSPNVNAMLQFIVIPLVVAFVSLYLFNTFLPKLNTAGKHMGNYFEDQALSNLDNMNYVQILPPMLFVMVLFFILLFQGKLG